MTDFLPLPMPRLGLLLLVCACDSEELTPDDPQAPVPVAGKADGSVDLPDFWCVPQIHLAGDGRVSVVRRQDNPYRSTFGADVDASVVIPEKGLAPAHMRLHLPERVATASGAADPYDPPIAGVATPQLFLSGASTLTWSFDWPNAKLWPEFWLSEYTYDPFGHFKGFDAECRVVYECDDMAFDEPCDAFESHHEVLELTGWTQPSASAGFERVYVGAKPSDYTHVLEDLEPGRYVVHDEGLGERRWRISGASGSPRPELDFVDGLGVAAYNGGTSTESRLYRLDVPRAQERLELSVSSGAFLDHRSLTVFREIEPMPLPDSGPEETEGFRGIVDAGEVEPHFIGTLPAGHHRFTFEYDRHPTQRTARAQALVSADLPGHLLRRPGQWCRTARAWGSPDRESCEIELAEPAPIYVMVGPGASEYRVWRETLD